MESENRVFLSIDLKSFYASVECMERGLNPMTTNLVVADKSRTEKTICLAVSPSLKRHGISGRSRLFEVIQKVQEVNARRQRNAPKKQLTAASFDDIKLRTTPELAVDFLIAKPRMAKYMEISTQIYHIYLKYIAPEDIHVYSIDEVFIDATAYLNTYRMTGKQLAQIIILDILKTTGITATAGIGTNLYLSKIAMDIVAKHIEADENGVRIAELDEMSYRKLLWTHQPLTDFWRIGKGYVRKLNEVGLYTMGDIARCSLGRPDEFYNEDLLYRLFGINAELLIDHAWGWEPCQMADIKAYKPETNSIGSGHVLSDPYTSIMARTVTQEMIDTISLTLVEKGLVTDQLVLTIGYDIENLSDPDRRAHYHGEITKDHYGRSVPKHAHGTLNLSKPTSSSEELIRAMTTLYDQIVNPKLLIRRINMFVNRVVEEQSVQKEPEYVQLDLFTDYEALEKQKKKEEVRRKKERNLQEAMLSIKKKYGKNSILKGISYQDGATARERNDMIGGHKA